eukprot:TRINITY_DN2010_c0_g1_i1.p1 TRINITY_DN2010_c0_g1~~TRINITY_DN2010_c0_g1_i1.p1  ORF type:complete len:872 (+),score=230.19 TRINITY_DN2010_c0_g1_i1:41-2656(+)
MSDNHKVEVYSPDREYVHYGETMGEGSFKKVYKAYRLNIGIEVAWSEINTTRLSEHEKKSLRREFQLLTELSHPNILTMYDFWKTDSHVYFITELMSSGSLAEYVQKIQVSKQIIVNFGKQILIGLDYLHSRTPKVIHRDLKCANIFVNGQSGICKIGDLGLASAVTNRAVSTVGTPEFMPPEMFKNELYDEKVDIYEFGMCLLEMSTGKFPYEECSNVGEIINSVMNRIMPEVLDKVEDHSLKAVIEQCLLAAELRPSASDLLKLPFFGSEIKQLILKPLPLQIGTPFEENASFASPNTINSGVSQEDIDFDGNSFKCLNLEDELNNKDFPMSASNSVSEKALSLRRASVKYIDEKNLHIELILSVFSVKKKVNFQYSAEMSVDLLVSHLIKSMKEIPEDSTVDVDNITQKLHPLIEKAFEEALPNITNSITWDKMGKILSPTNGMNSQDIGYNSGFNSGYTSHRNSISLDRNNISLEATSPSTSNNNNLSDGDEIENIKNTREQAVDALIEVLGGMNQANATLNPNTVANVVTDDIFDELWNVNTPKIDEDVEKNDDKEELQVGFTTTSNTNNNIDLLALTPEVIIRNDNLKNIESISLLDMVSNTNSDTGSNINDEIIENRVTNRHSESLEISTRTVSPLLTKSSPQLLNSSSNGSLTTSNDFAPISVISHFDEDSDAQEDMLIIKQNTTNNVDNITTTDLVEEYKCLVENSNDIEQIIDNIESPIPQVIDLLERRQEVIDSFINQLDERLSVEYSKIFKEVISNTKSNTTANVSNPSTGTGTANANVDVSNSMVTGSPKTVGSNQKNVNNLIHSNSSQGFLNDQNVKAQTDNLNLSKKIIERDRSLSMNDIFNRDEENDEFIDNLFS